MYCIEKLTSFHSLVLQYRFLMIGIPNPGASSESNIAWTSTRETLAALFNTRSVLTAQCCVLRVWPHP